jgi:hypothetical protein
MEEEMDTKSPAIAQRRAWNYWFEDGLPTLVGGLGCVFFGLAFIFDHSLFRLVLMGIYCFFLLRHQLIVDWLKTRLTYPRTGYVTPPYSPQGQLAPLPHLAGLSLEAAPARLEKMASEQRGRKWRLVLVTAMVSAAFLATMFIDRPWMYTVAGMVLALALWGMNGKEFQLSWFAIGGIPLIGIVLAISRPEVLTPAHRLGFFVFAVGLWIVADGAVALVRHLWRNPMASVPAK